jgi:GT2 family glycosyltransferase
MGTLIGMAVYSTHENQKDKCLAQTLASLNDTVDFTKHRLMLSVNARTEETMHIIRMYNHIIDEVFFNHENIGTARAINKCWALREPGEHCIKCDDDWVVNDYNGWLDDMEECIRRDPKIGQVALKRKDCWENPAHEHPDYRSTLQMLQHVPGEKWLIVEKVRHCIGTCVLHNSALLDKVGFLYQPSQYGYDDVIMSHRSEIAGFYNCFIPHVPIDHIDAGTTPYQPWKERHAGEQTQGVIDLVHAMLRGEKSIYYPL